MKIFMMSFLLGSNSLLSYASNEARCFCKALCLWNDPDSSDHSINMDVPCALSKSKQKDLLRKELKKHINAEHGVEYSPKEFSNKTEITCYRSSVGKKNNKSQKTK